MNKKKQFEKLQLSANILSAELEGLQRDIEDAQLNLPDNLQESAMANKMQARFDSLEEVICALDDFVQVDWSDPE